MRLCGLCLLLCVVVCVLEVDVTEAELSIQSLLKMIKKLTKKVNANKKHIEKKCKIIDQLQHDYAQLQAQFNQLDEHLNKKCKVINEMQIQIQHLHDHLDDCCPERPVAFTAYARATQLLHVGDLIKMPGVISNYVNHYNPATSHFTCPYDGIYFFTFTINSHYMDSDKVSLPYGPVIRAQAAMKAGAGHGLQGSKELVDVYSENVAGSYVITSSSNSVVYCCPKGQKIWLEAEFDKNAVWGLVGHQRSTFGGFLLRKEQCKTGVVVDPKDIDVIAKDVLRAVPEK